MTSVAVVVPTIRESCLATFLDLWRIELAGARLIIVEDNPEPTFATPPGLEHYAHRDIDRALGGLAWIVPRRTSAVRSFGIWLAARDGADVIWTLDDDCYPEPGHAGAYLDLIRGALSGDVPQGSWLSTIPDRYGVLPRGFPYAVRDQRRPVMVHHGLWSQVPDLDGMTQKARPDVRLDPARDAQALPYGPFFPMCVMNLAFRAEMAPAMYMLLMGRDRDGQRWGFDRFDDIWAGLFVKRICDHLGYAITSGTPSVRHSKASSADANIALEAAGIPVHEEFWPYVRDVRLTAKTVAGCYAELAAAVAEFSGRVPYWPRLGMAMRLWADLLA